MAESAVSFVVTNLVPFLVQEAKLLKGVPRQIESIKDDLDYIRVFLKDADARAETNEQVKIWVKQVRQVAFRMEDVLDEFRLRIAQQHLYSGCSGWVRKTFGLGKRLKPRHAIATEVQDIKAKLVEIRQRKEDYQFQCSVSSEFEQASGSSPNNIATWKDDALYVEESELVGIEEPTKKVESWLVEEEERQMVFAVLGTGGVGKTTLVRRAYQSDRVRSHFHCHAWITVSQSFKIEVLLVKLIKELHESRKDSIPQGVDAMERTQLIDELRDYLRQKRYVVILDDVWTVTLWNSLKRALLDNRCGSRIMVTTRELDVATSFVEEVHNHIYRLDPLPMEDALDLFYKKAFRSESFEGRCPPYLEEYSKKIVKSSGGLPLAIVAMAGLLLTKEKTVLEWKKFHDSLSSKLGEDPRLTPIMKIISLSYHDLPYYLKSCFLYFGLFPEDVNIGVESLVPLWVAEGFVQEKKRQTLEEVARSHLDHLVNRSLVQVSKPYPSEFFKVHDLMREFILSRLVEEDFCEVVDGNCTGPSHKSSRRLSIQHDAGGECVMKSTNSLSHVRSLLVCGLHQLPKSLMHRLICSSTNLKILVLNFVPLENFPDEITNLFHLRYLDLCGTLITVLPNTVARLQSLETLNVTYTCLVELPRAILKLKKLRHIEAFTKDEAAVKIPEGIGCLTALQSLFFVDVNQSDSIITDLGKLTRLRILNIANFKAQSGVKLCSSIAKMNSLSSLRLHPTEKDEILDLQFVSSPPSLLQELSLKGRLEKLPDWISSLSQLVEIYLLYSRLMHDPMRVLKGLPNLKQISLLDHAYDGEELHFQTGCFRKLEFLVLSKLDRLHSVTIEKGALPILKEMDIESCKQLKVVPDGIEHVTSLKTLEIDDMPEDFTERLSQDGGEDYWKVKHVPNVFIKDRD